MGFIKLWEALDVDINRGLSAAAGPALWTEGEGTRSGTEGRCLVTGDGS